MMDEILAEMEKRRNRRHATAKNEQYIHGLPKLMNRVKRGKKIRAVQLFAKRKMECVVEAKFRESLEEKAFNDMLTPRRPRNRVGNACAWDMKRASEFYPIATIEEAMPVQLLQMAWLEENEQFLQQVG